MSSKTDEGNTLRNPDFQLTQRLEGSNHHLVIRRTAAVGRGAF